MNLTMNNNLKPNNLLKFIYTDWIKAKCYCRNAYFDYSDFVIRTNNCFAMNHN